jgi:hypothetical protein
MNLKNKKIKRAKTKNTPKKEEAMKLTMNKKQDTQVRLEEVFEHLSLSFARAPNGQGRWETTRRPY